MTLFYECLLFDLENMMAQAQDLTAIEKQWVKKALETQRNVLLRSRNNEMAGSEIWTLRGKEIEQLTVLIGRFS